jgi:hypothetical protein
MNVNHIIQHFNIDKKEISWQAFGSGHINDTYKLATSNGKSNYLLQRINHDIFLDVPALMNNIHTVVDHIRHKLTPEEIDQGQTALRINPTSDEKWYYQDTTGNYWRIYDFLEGLKSYDQIEHTTQIYEGALSFGRFLHQLEDLAASCLHVTIPKFNDVLYRLDNLSLAIEVNLVNRKEEVLDEIKFVYQVADQLSEIQLLANKNQIPLRVTHNDTKFNNVMLGADNKGKCVIDLDTVMPGIAHYDFGDGVRTSISTAKEDEKDLNNIAVDLHRFEAFASGYLENTRNLLTSIEIDYLALSGPLFSYIMGVRFLTDHLNGDTYYKISFDGQNLQRAQSQFELTRKMLSRLKDMQQIVANQVSRNKIR